MGSEPKILPALGDGETYTDRDFLLVQTSTDDGGQSHTVIDRMFATGRLNTADSWACETIAATTKMSHGTALAMAKVYAREHQVHVIYHQHDGAPADFCSHRTQTSRTG